MRIVVFDYSGHPGQIQLSRWLASQSHHVLHLHCPDYTSGKGDLSPRPEDAEGPGSLTIGEVRLGASFDRYSLIPRIRQEIRAGWVATHRILSFSPDVVVLSNVPLLGHAVLAERLKRHGVPMVFWHQDIYSRAIGEAARRRLGPAGPAVAHLADSIERRVARISSQIVAISGAYLPTLERWGVPPADITVIPNCVPVDEIVPRPRENDWALRHDLQQRPVAMYTGTLGLKHDPSLLLEMALEIKQSMPEARLVVVSQGQGREFLEAQACARSLDQLVLLDYQPFEELPDVLGSANVVVALLEPEAGVFSVPSKVLTYLCAGRPVLGVMPPENQAAKMIEGAEAGWIVPAGKRVEAVDQLVAALADIAGTAEAGRRGRKFAETTFAIDTVGRRFEGVLEKAVGPTKRARALAADDLVKERSKS